MYSGHILFMAVFNKSYFCYIKGSFLSKSKCISTYSLLTRGGAALPNINPMQR